jgi:hypothetical protein
MIGVDKFYLVNNRSMDNYSQVLEPYVSNNVVQIYNLDVDIIGNEPNRKNEQILVKEWVNKMNQIVLNSDDDWMIHVSTDEFIFPTKNSNIKDVLSTYDDNFGEISVNWTIFGNNGISLNDGELIIENLIKSSLGNHEHNYHVKPILRPKAVLNIPSVHFANLKSGFIKVDANGNCNNFKNKYETINRVLEPLHINHYRLRDLSWTNKKIDIYKLWDRNDFLDLKDKYNDVENKNILRFVEPLKDRINKTL